jgi:hypothetical protein
MALVLLDLSFCAFFDARVLLYRKANRFPAKKTRGGFHAYLVFAGVMRIQKGGSIHLF